MRVRKLKHAHISAVGYVVDYQYKVMVVTLPSPSSQIPLEA